MTNALREWREQESEPTTHWMDELPPELEEQYDWLYDQVAEHCRFQDEHWRHANDPPDEDEVFLATLRSASASWPDPPPNNVRAWLMVILKRRWIDLCRKSHPTEATPQGCTCAACRKQIAQQYDDKIMYVSHKGKTRKAKTYVPKATPVVSRPMTDEERQRYGVA